MITLLVAGMAFAGLYLSKIVLQRFIQAVTLLISGSNRPSVPIYSLLFFPGIVMHELSHFLTAAFLGVHTGEIDLLPQTINTQSRVALGSVKVAKTDFVRSSIIGAAPTLIGLGLLYISISLYIDSRQSILDYALIQQLGKTLGEKPLPITILLLYAVWCIGNTIFTSKEDMRTWPIFLAATGGLIALVTAIGLGNKTWLFIFPWLTKAADIITIGIAGALIVNLIMLLFFGLIKLLLEKLMHKRVIYH